MRLSHNANKLLLIERTNQAYTPATGVPMEYLQLVMPYAGILYYHDDDCDIVSQHIRLGPFSLWLHDVFAFENIILQPYTPRHIWALHFMFEASLRAELYRAGSFPLRERECNLFNLHAHLHEAPMAAGDKMLSFHINILPGALPLLAGKYPAFHYLSGKKIPATSGIINERPYRINPVCEMLIQNMLTCKYVERQAHYFLYRCCVDLFTNFAAQDAQAQQPPILAGLLYKEIFNSIFTLLKEHPHNTCSIPELAFIYDIPVKDLRIGFRQHFCMEIEAFMHMQKMMMAYHLLMQKSLSLPAVASMMKFESVQEMGRALHLYYDRNMVELRRMQ